MHQRSFKLHSTFKSSDHVDYSLIKCQEGFCSRQFCVEYHYINLKTAMFDLNVAIIFHVCFLAGLYFCFKKLTDANIFIIMYGVTSIYFAVRFIYKIPISLFVDFREKKSFTFFTNTIILLAVCCHYKCLSSKANIDQGYH